MKNLLNLVKKDDYYFWVIFKFSEYSDDFNRDLDGILKDFNEKNNLEIIWKKLLKIKNAKDEFERESLFDFEGLRRMNEWEILMSSRSRQWKRY